MSEKRLPARERWLWGGMGFAGALAVALLAWVLAGALGRHQAPRQIIVRRPAASPPKPHPSATAAHPRNAKLQPLRPARKVAHSEARKPLVRIVERPMSEAHASTPPAARSQKPSFTSQPAKSFPRNTADPPVMARSSDTASVAGSREEWPDRSKAPTAPSDLRAGAPPAGKLVATPPQLLRSRGAEYPASAADDGVTGTVRVRLHIGADGRVDQVDVARSSGDARLDAAAARAALGWRYLPARRNGRSVPSTDHAQFEFFHRGDE